MNNPIYTKEKNILFQTFFNNDVKEMKIEDDGSAVADESSSAINEEKLRATKGVINALIFCIPIWFFFIKFIIWLVQK